MFNNEDFLRIEPINFEKVFTLHEQYLYGSKRLGVRRPKLQLPTAPHLLEVCALELLQVPLLPVKRADCFRCRESETIQKRTECLAFPQRLTAAGCAKSKIQFGNQKSEINQVLDRKTGVKASPTATTYAWFKADVTTAQDYYPFGSLMPGRTYVAPTGAGYRFGFNGQQRDDEIYGTGNSYTADFWQYDSRLGRRWNLDPVVKSHESPYSAFGNNPIWFIDPNGDDTLKVNRDGLPQVDLPEIEIKSSLDLDAIGKTSSFAGSLATTIDAASDQETKQPLERAKKVDGKSVSPKDLTIERNKELAKLGKAAKIAGAVLGVVGVVDHAADLAEAYKKRDKIAVVTNSAKIIADVTLILVKANPIVAALSLTYTIADSAGYLDFKEKQ